MADLPLRVGEVERGPVIVVERAPYLVVAVDRDRVGDVHGVDGAADVRLVVLEPELRGVHADHDQAWVVALAPAVFLGPGAGSGGESNLLTAAARPGAGYRCRHHSRVPLR